MMLVRSMRLRGCDKQRQGIEVQQGSPKVDVGSVSLLNAGLAGSAVNPVISLVPYL
jgi:hypothetical protein